MAIAFDCSCQKCIPRMAAALISLTRMPGTGPTPMAKASTYDSVPTSAMVPLMACRHEMHHGLQCVLHTEQCARDHAHLLNTQQPATCRIERLLAAKFRGFLTASWGSARPADMHSMAAAWPRKLTMRSCLRPARSTSAPATSVPSTLMAPTPALASAPDSMPACGGMQCRGMAAAQPISHALMHEIEQWRLGACWWNLVLL